jgi:DNA ligase-1
VRRFAALHEALDRTTSTTAKVRALEAYFREAPPADAAWALFFLTGRRLKRLMPSRVLWELAGERAAVPVWLLEHCYAAVGDLAEVAALLVEDPSAPPAQPVSLARWVEERVLPLKGQPLDAQKAALVGHWCGLPAHELLVVNKLITGEFRVGASATLVVRALAAAAGVEPGRMTERLMGHWDPTPAFFTSLLTGAGDTPTSRPYPFCLAYPLDVEPEALGPRAEWQAEWKWDGIRAQVVRREASVFVWSRGEELVTERFPEIAEAAARLPAGTVLDGEVLAWEGGVMPFSTLQTRIGRQKLGPAALRDAPLAFMAYDLLEREGVDLRAETLASRRRQLQELLDGVAPRLLVSPVVEADTWEALGALRNEARERRVEGLMLKRLASPYGTGRRKGDWWKWKIEPYSVDAVLLYAHPGHGKRANLFTDYTFAVWQDGQLLPFAKAYSGLDDEEVRELDAWVRRHTKERFGPVRAVEPVQVFEIGFEGISASRRHKSGVAVRFPRILRWRRDKPAAEADTLDAVKALVDDPQAATAATDCTKS